MPQLSLVLPVYNNAETLVSVIDSILQQSYTDFQLIVLDDCSNDDTSRIIKGYTDSRLRYMRFPSHYGYVYMLNRSLAEALSNNLVVFIHADHTLAPACLAALHAYMQEHPDIYVCGGREERITRHRQASERGIQDDEILASLLFFNPFDDGPIAFRTSLFTQKGFRFRNHFRAHLAMYDLLYRMKDDYHMHMIDEVLSRQIRVPVFWEQETYKENAAAFFIEKLNQMGISPDTKELKVHVDLHHLEAATKFRHPLRYKKWLDKLQTANGILYAFPREELDKIIARRWKELFVYMEQKNAKRALEYMRVAGSSSFDIFMAWMRYKLRGNTVTGK